MSKSNQNLTKRSTQRFILPAILLIAVFMAACGNTTETQTTPPTAGITEERPLPTFEPTEETESPADTQAPSTSDSEVSFSNDIFPIFQKSCFQCHGTGGSKGGFSLIDYDQLMEGGNSGTVIVPGDADNSLLVKFVVTQRMPKQGPKLTPEQIQLITDWINQGALDN